MRHLRRESAVGRGKHGAFLGPAYPRVEKESVETSAEASAQIFAGATSSAASEGTTTVRFGTADDDDNADAIEVIETQVGATATAADVGSEVFPIHFPWCF